MGVGVHIVLLLRQKPGEVSHRRAELIEPERFRPSEHFPFTAFLDQRDLIVEESEVTVLADILAGKHVSADETGLHTIVIESLESLDRHSRKGNDIRSVLDNRSGNGHLAGKVDPAGLEELSDGRESEQGQSPDGLTFLYRRDVADLHTNISGRMLLSVDRVDSRVG